MFETKPVKPYIPRKKPRKSRAKYMKGRPVDGIMDFISLLCAEALFIKDEPIRDPEYFLRHPRGKQAQSSAFMKAQQFWYVLRLIDARWLFVAEPIDKEL
jgi:hypothetical protein